MSIKKIMHKDRHGAQVSVEFGEGGAASQLVEQFLGGMGVPAMQEIPREHPGGPKGTDTVPAWLTPGEFVMNAEATRMFEPQIEEMNNAGRAVQRQQGGSIPEYKAEGGFTKPTYFKESPSWLTGGLLDSLMQVESGGNPNAVSPAGARGPYQIMPATAANPGYGVTPISPQDVTDPLKSRQFAEMYLEALAVKYPDATKDEVLQMYNAGPGRVLRANADNPLTKETLDYPGKIAAAMVSDDSVPPVSDDSVDSRPMPPSVRGDNLTEDEFLAKIPGSQAVIDGLSTVPGYASSMFKALMPAPPSYYGDPQGTKDIGMLENKEGIQSKIDSDRASLQTELIEGTGTGGLLSRGVRDIQSDIEDVNERQRRLDSSLERSDQKEITNEEGELKAKQQRVADLRAAGLNERADALEAGLATSETEEPSDNENTISGLIDAGNKAKEVDAPEGEVVDEETKGSSAWDKVKDFFKEGFGTILDKGALSEAATLYLGSRALGYGHEGSLNFVAKRYGKGIEDKLAIANKAVGTYTPESITKYKDTGNLNDLALIKTLTDTNETEYWTDPKTGAEITLRVAKDEKGRKVLVGPDDNPVDTKKFLKASEYKSRDEYNQKKIKPIMESKLRKFELDNGMAKGEGEAVLNIPQVSQAMSMYAIENSFNTSKINELSDYVFNSIIETRDDPKNKGMSDRNLTNLALQKGIARQMEADMFLKPNGKPAEPTVVGEVLDLMDGLPQDPVPQGQMLKTMYQYGYMSRTPDERKQYTKDAKGRSSGYLEYLKQQGYITDRDNWVPAWRQLNGQ